MYIKYICYMYIIYIQIYIYIYIYIYLYILFMLFDHFEEGTILKRAGTNHPRMKLWYRGEEVLIKKVFHLTQKENIKKTK